MHRFITPHSHLTRCKKHLGDMKFCLWYEHRTNSNSSLSYFWSENNSSGTIVRKLQESQECMNNKDFFARLVGNHLQLDCKFPLNLYNVCRLSMGLEPYYFVSLSGGNETKMKVLSLFTHPRTVPNPQRQKEIFLFVMSLNNSCHTVSMSFKIRPLKYKHRFGNTIDG